MRRENLVRSDIYHLDNFVVVIASPKGAAISLFNISNVEIASLSLAMTSNC